MTIFSRQEKGPGKRKKGKKNTKLYNEWSLSPPKPRDNKGGTATSAQNIIKKAAEIEVGYARDRFGDGEGTDNDSSYPEKKKEGTLRQSLGGEGEKSCKGQKLSLKCIAHGSSNSAPSPTPACIPQTRSGSSGGAS